MPLTLTYPGVYIEELPSGVHTITGVPTSIAAFVGWAPQGPTDQATLVESWTDFETQFGGLTQDSGTPNYLGYAVNQFFNNGGSQAYIVRLVADGHDGTTAAGTASATLTDTNNLNPFLTVQAANQGNWALNYGIVIKARPGTSPPLSRFTLLVVYAPGASQSANGREFPKPFTGSRRPTLRGDGHQRGLNYIGFAPGYTPPTLTLPTSIQTGPFMLLATSGTAATGLPIDLQDNNSETYLQIQPSDPAAWPAKLGVLVQSNSTNAGNFDLEVVYQPASPQGVTVPVKLESFTNLSVNPKAPHTWRPLSARRISFQFLPITRRPLRRQHCPTYFRATQLRWQTPEPSLYRTNPRWLISRFKRITQPRGRSISAC